MLDEAIKELKRIAVKADSEVKNGKRKEYVRIKRVDLIRFCLKLVRLLKHFNKSEEEFNYDALIRANTKLLDDNKSIKSDIKFLIDYMMADDIEKEELEERAQNIIRNYK